MSLFARVVRALTPAPITPVDHSVLSFWQRFVVALARRGTR